jgi:outer membrane protein assembly factor BamB
MIGTGTHSTCHRQGGWHQVGPMSSSLAARRPRLPAVFALAVGLVAAAGVARAAAAATVSGVVFLDRDGNGVWSDGDTPLPGARVALDISRFVDADATGAYSLQTYDGASGFLWVSVPEDGMPGPAWTPISDVAGAVHVDLPVRPAVAPPSRRFSFVVASDTHIGGPDPQWSPDDMTRVVGQALALDEPARFFTVTGDVTQQAKPGDFDQVQHALAHLPVPWVPVPGNHDWYDGGNNYRHRWGPDNYSFTTGGVHFVVWNSATPPGQLVHFFQEDLRGVDPATTVIALGHIPPRDDLVAHMQAAGVDYLFTGHWHSNRRVVHDKVIELGTQNLLTGGIDLAPAGYRVVSLDNGAMTLRHRTVVDEPVLHLMWPLAEPCVAPGGTLIASAEGGVGTSAVAAAIDGSPIAMAPAGGWVWTGAFAPLTDGPHQVDLQLQGADGLLAERHATFTVCSGSPPPPLDVSDDSEWLQHQGDPRHHGSSPTALELPLATAWVAAVGGHLHLGAPVVAHGRVYVSFSDFDAGGGGVAAFDVATGVRVWTFSTDVPVRHAPAISGDTVIFASTAATVWGLDAATGARTWSVDLGAGFDKTETALWSPPTVVGDVVYVGQQHHMAALDAATGTELWSAAPENPGDTSGSCSAAAVADGEVFSVFHGHSGLHAWRLPERKLHWRDDDATTLDTHGAIVLDDDTVYAGDGRGTERAFDRHTGAVRWARSVVGADDWAFVTGSAALADGRLFVPTQWGAMAALDAKTGRELWRFGARLGPIRTAHSRGRQAGFQASPLVAGDTVWIADTSGLLSALDARTGKVKWQMDLGVPVLGGMAVADGVLLVTSWDGTLHALAPPYRPVASCGGCVSATPSSLFSVVLPLMVASLIRARRRARARR